MLAFVTRMIALKRVNSILVVAGLKHLELDINIASWSLL
jgi:hypothetical protein